MGEAGSTVILNAGVNAARNILAKGFPESSLRTGDRGHLGRPAVSHAS